MKRQILTYRRIEFQLYQDSDGMWGWMIGNAMLVASFRYRDSALSSAHRHIDELKSK